jgi:hypothetical protein
VAIAVNKVYDGGAAGKKVLDTAKEKVQYPKQASACFLNLAAAFWGRKKSVLLLRPPEHHCFLEYSAERIL